MSEATTICEALRGPAMLGAARPGEATSPAGDQTSAGSPPDARKLPLWRSFYTDAKDAGRFKYGAFFTVAELELALAAKEDTAEFRFSVSLIRRALRREGKNFTERGQQGSGLLIAPVETNANEIQRLQSAALSAMREGVILGTTTPLELLTAEDRRRHEAIVERLGKRLALISRQSLPACYKEKLKELSPAK